MECDFCPVNDDEVKSYVLSVEGESSEVALCRKHYGFVMVQVVTSRTDATLEEK